MSLRVWLPLNGTLDNKGLSNINLTDSPIYATGGKIGNQCLASQLRWFEIPDMAGKKQMSFAYWVKINTATSTNWLDTFSWYSTDGSTNHRSRQEFYTNSTQTGVWFQGGKSGTTFRNTVGDWNHYAFTIDYNKGEAKFYINGELTNTNLAVDTTHYIKGTGSAFLLRESALDSHINDFRLYDHILSPLEVKQISQGLILHYPLNRGGFGQENLFNWSNNVTGITLNDYQNVGSFTQFTNSLSFDPSATVGKKYTISFWAKSPNGTTSLLLYNSNSKPKYFNFNTTLTSNLGIEWQFFKYTVTNIQYTGSDASTNTSIWKRIEIYAPHKMKVQVKQIKVEEGEVATPWCPNSADELAISMDLNGTIEYDTSGYGNNGAKNNSPTYSSDTAKYNVSTHLDGVNQTIQLPNLTTLTPDSIFTFNIWFKRLSAEPSSKPWETILGGPSGFELETCSANNVHDNKVKAYSWGSGTFEFELDKWNMLTMVSNGANALFYLNGNLKLTGTYKALVSGKYFIGSWRDTASQNYKGYVSDVRIYATALSAEDIKSLYNNSAYIDNQGNIYGAVYEEV